ncbi:MAG: PilC/PilY family type IV pilus protein [Desulforegulaceae bacterium]|nr:PilC/PilY family type IV pilus protein [Desulforegulaceae bacterium]
MIFNKLIKKTIFFLGFGFICLNSFSAFAANSDYAALPPFISADVKPNVLFVMDFSGSMQAPAYYGSHKKYYNSNVSYCGSSDREYDKTKKYYGYFDSYKFYKYNESEEYWEINPSGTGKDVPTSYTDSVSGNFFNFILMSRVDAAFKGLFGGKGKCYSTYCILEPQGARRIIKISNYEERKFEIAPENYSSGNYLDKKMRFKIGKKWVYAGVKVDKEDRKGIIQENFNKVRFGFMAYANSGNKNVKEGKIKFGLHEKNMDTLIEQFEKSLPYNGTHTGEALREAHYYLSQSYTTHNFWYETSFESKMKDYNSSYFAPETEKDPYYEKNSNGNLEAAWCRKSYVVLISDGEYNDGALDPYKPAHNLHLNDLRTEDDFPGKQNAEVYSLFAFSDDEKGQNSMKTVAAFGKYEDLDGCSSDKPYDFDKVKDSRTFEFPTDNCNPKGKYNNCCKEWDKDGDGVPDNYFEASDGDAMASAFTAIFSEIRHGASSGTAVTSLTSRVSGGSVLGQAAFYPNKEFENKKEINWASDFVANWYLNDYFKNASGVTEIVQNIREDTNKNYILNIEEDRIIEYLVENDSLKVNYYKSNKHGVKADTDPEGSHSSLQKVNNLFDCGEKLKTTKPEDRKIWGVDKDDKLKEFKDSNSHLFKSNLGNAGYEPCLLDQAGNPDFKKLINYTRGKDFDGCRLRTTSDSFSENVWKLGDIIYSTPTIVGYGDYSMVYLGSNSGMLHAFRLGYLKSTGDKLNPSEICDKKSVDCTQVKIGKEEWAFVPKDSMPYLRYLASPDYEHIYTVDLAPYIVNTDSQIILIGGMRLGGGTENGLIKPPSDTGTVGRSAYFALDITDPQNPKYLWRYAPDELGFSYSGPAYVKRKLTDGKYKHFLIFASGTTGYDGTSVQPLSIFTIDLLTGAELKKHSTGIENAFGGSLFTDGLDIDNDGQTDFVFLGYTDNANGKNDDKYKKMGGGIIKIHTGSASPSEWEYDTSFFEGAKGNPVTASILVSRCFTNLTKYPYVYFGTGRYFVPNDDTQKGSENRNYLYGIPFPFNEKNESKIIGTKSIKKANDLKCSDLDDIKSGNLGWKIPLDLNDSPYLRERCYSDAVIGSNNLVFFNTAMPTNAVCECGGQSRSWALNCATGKTILKSLCSVSDDDNDPFTINPKTKFRYLIQLSRGDIKDYGQDDFNNGGLIGFVPGVPPPSAGNLMEPRQSEVNYWKLWRQ